MEFLDNIHNPNRDRMLTCMKFMMVMFKSHSSRSKYALELLRFLCHQQASYSKQTAHQMFYGLFVNNRGKKGSHIPADLEMEHIVNGTKKILKGLGPMNKDDNLRVRSKAVAALNHIAINFDEVTNIKARAQFHKTKEAMVDEHKMIKDLRNIKPFVMKPGRSFEIFRNIKAPVDDMDKLALYSWIDFYKNRLDADTGK